MPERSLRSPVFRWPNRPVVERALRVWVEEERPHHPGVRRVGYFGSYATDTWGPGSDLDVVAVIDDGASAKGFEERATAWRTERLPVPADLLVYTESEWRRLIDAQGAFGRMVATGVVWIYRREDDESAPPGGLACRGPA